MAFYENGSVKMIRNDMILDKGVTWRFDGRHNPMQLDLVLTDSSGETKVLPMIVRFISDTEILLRMSGDMKTRPDKFSDSDEVNQIILTKRQR